MNFREYGEVKPVTLVGDTPKKLDDAIEKLGREYDIIDLQFASRTVKNALPEYSALALVRVVARRKTR